MTTDRTTPRGSPSKPYPRPGVVRRALWIAVAWSYVAALAALLVVGVATLVALLVILVIYLLDFSTRELDLATVWSPAIVVGWIVGPIAVGISVWVGAYGSTQRDPIRRGTLAIGAAAVGAVFMWFIGSLGIVAVALAAGWAFAIPAEHAGRWLARMLVVLGLFPFYPIWDVVGVEVIVLAALSGPVVAGMSVLIGDLAWMALLRVRARGGEETIRAPTSLDV